jgi:hypothetical protein
MADTGTGTSAVLSHWVPRDPLPSLGAVIALSMVGLVGIALSIFGIADTGPRDESRLVASVVGLVSGLVTLGASAVAASRRRRGLFYAARRIQDLQQLAAQVRHRSLKLTSEEVGERLRHARYLADDLAADDAFRESLALHRAIDEVEGAIDEVNRVD